MVIETSRLLMRKPQLQDFDRFWGMINDPVAKQYTGGITKLKYNQRLELFKEDCIIPFSDDAIEFAVIEKESGKYLGYCGFRSSDDLGGNEFLYGYCQDCWGQGYGFEAADAVLQYLFKTLRHDSYIATADAANIATVKILKKLGFRRTSQLASENIGVVDKYVIEKGNYLARSRV